jgi:hypothetical protein
MDKGGEYIFKAFLAFLREHGIVARMTVRTSLSKMVLLNVLIAHLKSILHQCLSKLVYLTHSEVRLLVPMSMSAI